MSRDHGLRPENLTAIARQWAPELKLTERDVIKYLTQNIHFDLDSQCLEGLQLYYRYAAEIGVLPSVLDLHFADSFTPQTSNF
jgi:chorismate dehydratase